MYVNVEIFPDGKRRYSSAIKKYHNQIKTLADDAWFCVD